MPNDKHRFCLTERLARPDERYIRNIWVPAGRCRSQTQPMQSKLVRELSDLPDDRQDTAMPGHAGQRRAPSARSSPYNSAHPSPRSRSEHPFPTSGHSAHSAGAVASGHLSGSSAPHSAPHGSFVNPYDNTPSGHFPQDPLSSRQIIDDVWPAPSAGGMHSLHISSHPGAPGSRPPNSPHLSSSGDPNLNSVFNIGGPFPPRPPAHAHLSAAVGNPPTHNNSGRRGSQGNGYSGQQQQQVVRMPSDNPSVSGYSSGGEPAYPLSSGPHSDGHHPARRSDAVQSIISLNTLGLAGPSSAPWGEDMSGHLSALGAGDSSGNGGGGYLTPRTAPVVRASSAPLAQQPSPGASGSGPANDARPKRRRRNEQQQVNNKLAQQRYREKQKQKTRELEGQVEELTAQVKALESSSGKSRELLLENEMLRTQLQQQQNNLDKLQAHVRNVDPDANVEGLCVPQGENGPNSATGGPSSFGDGAAAAAAAAGPPDNGPAGSAARDGDVDMEDRSGGADAASSGSVEPHVVQRLALLVDRMRKLLSDRGLPVDNVLADEVRYTDADLRRELATLVQGNSSMCAKLLLGKVPDGAAIMHSDASAARDLWGRCLVSIRLADQQVARILDARGKLLQRLQNLSEVRNHLALRAVGMLLPSPHQRQTAQHQTPESRLQSLEMNGAFEVLFKERELQDSLDEVSENLRKWRKVIMEFNQYFTTKVLNVEQAAVLLIIAHPYHPDCLAIANLMAQNQRNVTSGTDVRQ
eukprot:jgi/Ulvmu1/1972/UM012_0134.1